MLYVLERVNLGVNCLYSEVALYEKRRMASVARGGSRIGKIDDAVFCMLNTCFSSKQKDKKLRVDLVRSISTINLPLGLI